MTGDSAPGGIENAMWMAFSAGVTEDQAAAGFREKYGTAPAVVVKHLGNVLAGPVVSRRAEERGRPDRFRETCQVSRVAELWERPDGQMVGQESLLTEVIG